MVMFVSDWNSTAGSRDHEGNRGYGALETNTETDQTADTDASESTMPANRRRRSRRRRTDEDATLIDGMSESDNASMSENGIGERHMIWAETKHGKKILRVCTKMVIRKKRILPKIYSKALSLQKIKALNCT